MEERSLVLPHGRPLLLCSSAHVKHFSMEERSLVLPHGRPLLLCSSALALSHVVAGRHLGKARPHRAGSAHGSELCARGSVRDPFHDSPSALSLFFKGLEEKLLVFYERFFLALFCDFLLLC